MQENTRPGDKPELTNENRNKTEALEALRELQRIFKKSGISEAELQVEGRRVRREIAGECRNDGK